MGILDRVVRRVCEKVSKWAPSWRMITRGDNEPYLKRYYFFRREWVLEWFETQGWETPRFVAKIPSLYLHHFVAGDDEVELHNHPFKKSLALVLTGGYHEERKVGNEVHSRIVPPWSFNLIDANTFHKVELLDKEKGAWTIFLSGERTQRWGFWHPETFEYVDWENHVDARPNPEARLHHAP